MSPMTSLNFLTLEEDFPVAEGKNRAGLKVEICDNSQTFEGQIRMHGVNLAQTCRDQIRVSAGRNNVHFLPRKTLDFYPGNDLAHQAAITDHRTGAHRVDCRSSNRRPRFF